MAKKLAVVFGIVFVLVGVLGFFSNPIVGSADGALFLTDGLHNFVHLLIGIILLIASSKGAAASRKALIVFGVIYLVLAVAGFFQGDSNMLIGLVAANTADTYLHLVLGIVLLAVGLPAARDNTMGTM